VEIHRGAMEAIGVDDPSASRDAGGLQLCALQQHASLFVF